MNKRKTFSKSYSTKKLWLVAGITALSFGGLTTISNNQSWADKTNSTQAIKTASANTKVPSKKLPFASAEGPKTSANTNSTSKTKISVKSDSTNSKTAIKSSIPQNGWYENSSGSIYYYTNGAGKQIDVKSAGEAGFNNGIAGYPVGQCTGFVGSVLKAAGISSSKWSYLGNGTDWATNAKSRGLTVNSTPAVGSAISFHQYSGNVSYTSYGHVAFITQVNSDGSVKVAEGNFNSLAYHTRTISKAELNASANGIIHF